MNCEHATNLISARVDGEIGAEDTRTLDEHLAECGPCRATLEAMTAQDAELSRAFASRREAASRVAERVIFRVRGQTAGAAMPLRAVSPPRRRTLPWLLMVVSAAAGFALAVVLMRPWKHPVSDTKLVEGPNPPKVKIEPLARLALSTGAVECQPPGSQTWQPLATGAEIAAGTQVRTTDKSRCEFVLSDGSELRLNSNSQVRFAEARSAELVSGQIFSSLSPASIPFTLAAAQANISALGGQFDLSASGDSATVTVVSGSTTVRAREGGADPTKAVVVRYGEQARIAGGSVQRKEEVHDLLILTNWVNELLALKGNDNAEFRHRMDGMLAQIGQAKMDKLYEDQILALGDHCFLPLTRFVQSTAGTWNQGEKYKRAQAARILSQVARPWCVPDLIDLLQDGEGEVRYYAAKALVRLTGSDNGAPADQWRRDDLAVDQRQAAVRKWQAWWSAHKDGVPAGPMQKNEAPARAVEKARG